MITELKITNKYFLDGIPSANFFAPWQTPNLDTINMKPDLSNMVHYKLNSLGYRDQEFTPELLNNSIWCIGHSDTMGMGVDYKDTWPSLLKTLGHNTVNLGIAGASYDTFSRIVSSGLKIYKPKTIVLQATTKERKEYVSNDFKQVVLPNFPRDMLPHDDVWKYSDESTEDYLFERNMNLIKYACDSVNVKLISFDIPQRWDYIKQYPAYDNQHIGPEIHKQISLYVDNLIVSGNSA